MELEVVLEVLDALQHAEVRLWVGGGWGVDLLIARQTRPHRDLDLLVDARDHAVCLAELERLGYVAETDWLPIRVELAAVGERWVDVHPVVFDGSGRGVQGDRTGVHFEYPPTAFTIGALAGRPVPCLSLSQQLLFHTGYPPRPQDVHDLAQLQRLDAEGRWSPADRSSSRAAQAGQDRSWTGTTPRIGAHSAGNSGCAR